MKNILIFAIALTLIGCSGQTTVTIHDNHTGFSSSEMFLIIRKYSDKVPMGLGLYFETDITELEKISTRVPAIGKTDFHIKSFLEKKGFKVETGNLSDLSSSSSLILEYKDFWQWDLKMYLACLEIKLKNRISNKLVASTIYYSNNHGYHDFPTAESEVPIILNELLQKLQNK